MGMFDSLYDDDNNEWQTKAFDCVLDRFRVADPMPDVCESDYQVEVLGDRKRGSSEREFIESYATIRSGILMSINDPRDESLILRDYGGFWVINERKK